MIIVLNGQHTFLMKKFFFASLLLGIMASHAQTKTYIGIKGGGHVNSAFLNHTIFNFNAKTTFKPGINTGLLVKHFPKKRVSSFNSGIQGGVNYIQKGWTQTFPDTMLPNYHIKMNYVEIPIEGIGYFGKKNKYFISVGFFAEFLLSSEKDNDPVTTIDFVTYVEERDREIGYGGRTSAGIFRDFPFGSLQVEGFLTYSFSNFIDAGDLKDDQLPDISNLWSIGISVGYFMPFGKLDMTK